MCAPEVGMQTESAEYNAPEGIARSVWMYVALAFAISWTAWIAAIKLHAPEGFLGIGSAGPVIAAMVLCRSGRGELPRRPLRRGLTFAALLLCGWIVLSLYYAWRGSSHLPVRLNPWLIIPAVVPAWILSAAFSADAGVRSLLRRLVHRPGRWSIIAFLLFPAILLPGTILAKLLHLPLVRPASQGSTLNSIAFAAIFFLYNAFFVAAVEEPGWRGFLLDRLQRRWSPFVASLLVWLPWALWHAPLDYLPIRTLLAHHVSRGTGHLPHSARTYPDVALQPFRQIHPGDRHVSCRHEHVSVCASLLHARLRAALHRRRLCRGERPHVAHTSRSVRLFEHPISSRRYERPLTRSAAQSNRGRCSTSPAGTGSSGPPAFIQAFSPPWITFVEQFSISSMCATLTLVASRAHEQYR